jgi:hypothetical protein
LIDAVTESGLYVPISRHNCWFANSRHEFLGLLVSLI